MWKRRKNEDAMSKDGGRRPDKVSVCGPEGVLYSGSMQEMPLREAIILKKSEEYFNDPAPCFIHRSAVRVRLLAELEEAVKEKRIELWNEYTQWSQITMVRMSINDIITEMQQEEVCDRL